jgi:hypothetical protein
MTEKKHRKLANFLASPEPPKDLLEKIMNQIHWEQERRIIKVRFTLFSVLLVTSLIALIPTFKMIQTSFAQSEFINFIQLAFTDTKAIINYFDSFIVAILESLPVMAIALFLFVIFVLLESIKYIAQYSKSLFSPLKTNLKTN